MKEKFRETLWVAKQLFNRNLVTGSTGNISFRDGDSIYISKSGSCFGLLDESSFVKLSLDGTNINGRPSKEYPLHLALYNASEDNQVVLHTHSFYSTMSSCLINSESAISGLLLYSPYLEIMTGGRIKKVDYYKPGSSDLFEKFKMSLEKETKVYMLSNHGIVVTAKEIIDSFNVLEEFEASAKIFFSISNFCPDDFNKIM